MNIVCATYQPSLSSGAFTLRTQVIWNINSAVKGIASCKLFRFTGFAAAAVFVYCGMAQLSLGEQPASTKPDTAVKSHSTTNKPPQPALVWAQLPTTLKFSHATHVDLLNCSECHVLKQKNPYPAMSKCNECHEEVKAKEGSKECLMCHTSNDDYTAVYAKDGRNPNPCQPGYWGVNFEAYRGDSAELRSSQAFRPPKAPARKGFEKGERRRQASQPGKGVKELP